MIPEPPFLALPDGWEWADYNQPTAFRTDRKAMIDASWSSVRPRVRLVGEVPVEVREAFAKRMRELQDDPFE